MEYHDFIRLLKDTIIPLLPLIGVSACLSPEWEDGDQPQLGLRQLLPKPQQYLPCPQISPQRHPGIEAPRTALDRGSDHFLQPIKNQSAGGVRFVPSPWQFLRAVSRKTAGSRIVHFPSRLPCIFLLNHANLSKNNPKVNRVRLGCDAFLCYPLPENN